MPHETRTIHDNDDPNAASNQTYRATADALIKKSTLHGQLDLDELRANTANAARDIVFHSHGIEMSTHNGGVRDLVDNQIRNLSLATREVLGIVPQGEWKHNARDMLSNGLDWTRAQLGGEYEPTNGLQCRQNNQPVGYVDPHESLASQNITCAIPPRTPRGR